MKKKIAVLGTAAAVLLSSSMAFAGAWNVPSNVRVVQKSNTDTSGRIYGTIQAAINNITNASATNPYLVKVMPGTYAETVTLKPYITLEGSGKENTIITSVAVAGGFDCSKGTVNMANNSTIRNITVKATFTSASFADVTVNAVSLLNVKATAEGISAIATSTNANPTNGICLNGSTAHIKLENSYVEANATGGNDANVIMHDGGSSVTIINSKLVGIGSGNSAVDVVDGNHAPPTGPCSVIISNTSLQATHNSSIYMLDTPYCNTTVTNSSIAFSPSTYVRSVSVGDGEMKLGNTLIQGAMSGIDGNLANLKLVNCYDENFDSIP